MSSPTRRPLPESRLPRLLGHLVHFYTASGVVAAFMAMALVCLPQPAPRWVFLWLALALFIDATDGALARRWRVKETAPEIDGRTIDDILDYLTFTFIPLMLVWRMGWIPLPGTMPFLGGLLFVVPAMLASLLGFANVKAKEDEAGFFRGFPSYWNIAAFYAGLLLPIWGTVGNGIMLLVLAVLTVCPMRFIYPTLAPRPWRLPVLVGGVLWGAGLLAMLPWYPRAVPGWAVLLSLIYPAFYVALSIHLDARDRRRSRSG